MEGTTLINKPGFSHPGSEMTCVLIQARRHAARDPEGPEGGWCGEMDS